MARFINGRYHHGFSWDNNLRNFRGIAREAVVEQPIIVVEQHPIDPLPPKPIVVEVKQDDEKKERRQMIWGVVIFIVIVVTIGVLIKRL